MTDDFVPTTEQEAAEMPENFFGDDDVTAEEHGVIGDETEAKSEPIPDEPMDDGHHDDEGEKPENAQDGQIAPFMNIKYNKEEIALTQEEAVRLAQKGMNYDRMYEKLNPVFDQLSHLAALNDMSVEDYLTNLADVQDSFEMNREIEELRASHPNSDDDLLTELAQVRVSERKQNAASAKRDMDESRRAEIERQYDKFVDRYPDVDPAKLDSRVYGLMANGYTLLEAYQSVQQEDYQKQEAERISKEKIIRQNEENRRKSLGNISSTGEIDKDDFLAGFLSD